MKSIKVYQYDAFSKKPGKGNPAGIVLNGDELSTEEMQEIAFKVGFNETSFPIKSEVADFKIRFFTPGHEMNLCGHATMATIFALKSNGLLGDKTNLTIETKAGILPVTIHLTADDGVHITMNQAPPNFKKFKGSKQDLANLIGLEKSDLPDDLPILYGSTGTWTLLVPIKELKVFKKMKPNNKKFPSILTEIPKASVHPFCLETFDIHADMHARHFSSPYSGTVEDAVTGTASGVIGAYYAKYIDTNFQEPLELLIEQGHELNKDGRVLVQISKNNNLLDVKIAGNAVYVTEIHVSLEK